MEKIILIDLYLTNFFYHLFPHLPFFNIVFSFFSLKGINFFIWIFLIAFVVFFEERKNPGISKKDKKFIILFFLSFLLTAFVVEIPLKNFFHRQRPPIGKISCPSNFSFPSSHASTAFAAATVLAYFDKKRRFFYYLIASLIAYSRIYLACHYFFDVLVGGIIGTMIAKLILIFLPHKTAPDRP